jgi:branched-chain amino acid aminotransferase
MMPKRTPLVITSINGKFVAARDARISVLDNTFLYAEGLFETLLAVDDRLIFAKRHMERLTKGSAVIGLKLPYPVAMIRKWLVAAASKHSVKYKKVRLTITAGDSARWTVHAGKPQVVISVSEHRFWGRPYRLQVSDFRVDQESVFRQIKTVSYAIQAAAFRKAIASGFDDALLINESGNVAEVTSANIFWVRRGRLYTSPLSAGCLEGTTRKTVLDVARQTGIEVIERAEPLNSVCVSDEIFICSSLKLISPVALIAGGRRSWRLRTGPITEKLARLFEQMVETDHPLTR